MRLFSEEQLRLLLVNKITSPPSSRAILLPPTVFPNQASPRIWYSCTRGKYCLAIWLVWWTIHQTFIVTTYTVYNLFTELNYLMFSVEVNNFKLLSIVHTGRLSLFYCPCGWLIWDDVSSLHVERTHSGLDGVAVTVSCNNGCDEGQKKYTLSLLSCNL